MTLSDLQEMTFVDNLDYFICCKPLKVQFIAAALRLAADARSVYDS